MQHGLPHSIVGLGLLIGAIHLGCAFWIGVFEPLLTREIHWEGARWGRRGTSWVGVGLALIAGVLFLRGTSEVIGASGQWMILAGLVVAALGQAMVVASFFRKDSPHPDPKYYSAARKFCFCVPMIAFTILAALWRILEMR